MKDEYDFSKGQRGQFYRPNIQSNIPIYLDQDVKNWFKEKAKSQGVTTQQLINKLLRDEMTHS